MTQKTKILLTIAFGIFIILLFYVFYPVSSVPLNDPIEQTANAQEKGEVGKTTTLEVNNKHYEDIIKTEMTVYEFMSKLRYDKRVDFTEKNYAGMGKFIDSINGIKGDGNGSWIYYVNGEKAGTGVSNYKIKPGDVVSFKFEKIY